MNIFFHSYLLVHTTIPTFKRVGMFFLFLMNSLFLSSCLYDAKGPTKEKLNALKPEIILDLQNMTPQKEIQIDYVCEGNSYHVKNLKTSIDGSAIISLELKPHTNSCSKLEVKVDNIEKSSLNCNLHLIFTKENVRVICYYE